MSVGRFHLIVAFACFVATFSSEAYAKEGHTEASGNLSERLSKVLLKYGFDGEIAFSPSSYSVETIVHKNQADITDPKTVAEITKFKEDNPNASDAQAMAAVMPHDGATRWPWASVTKQVVAVLIMQQVESKKIRLDRNASRYLPGLKRNSPTVRQLLQHQSGLRNPDDSPVDENNVPDFYTTGPTGLDWCLKGRGTPGGDWRYNNCDYIVLGAILEKVTGKTLATLIEENIGSRIGWSDTRLLRLEQPGSYYGQDKSYDIRIARYGASAGLVGPLEDMLRFDRSFFGGSSFTRPIFSKESRDAMWESDPALGYMGLGQWVFEAPLAGCDTPVKIVERRGAIGKYQLRNITLPSSKTALAIATQKEGFEFGEIWTGRGFMYEALSVAACG